jgi:hypothetical protein
LGSAERARLVSVVGRCGESANRNRYTTVIDLISGKAIQFCRRRKGS